MIELSENIANYFLENFGKNFLENYREYINSEQKQFIRINTNSVDTEDLLQRLSEYNISLGKVENVPGAYEVISGRENIGKTIEYTIGKYYVQSLSSMIPALVLNPSGENRVLDLCAAPGSKTTQISEMMRNRGTLVANESALSRIRILAHNLDKYGIVNMGIINFRGEILSKIFNNYFDKILVDAPCSALGILQKKNEVSNWWNLSQAEKLSSMQLKLLISALKMLKVGGEIVYSTCTVTLEENELMLDTFLKKYPAQLAEFSIPVNSENALTSFKKNLLNTQLSKAKRIIPWEVNSEGFFVAKLIKTGETEPKEKFEFKNRRLKIISSGSREIKDNLFQLAERFGIEKEYLSELNFILKKSDVFFINNAWEISDINPFTRIGTKFGNIDKRGYIHLHSNSARFLGGRITKNIIELKNTEQLKTYFSGGTIKENFLPYGQKAIKWQSFILGMATANKDGLKSQFPRSMRTHEIIFPSSS